MDQVVVPFLDAAFANNATRVILDIETSPQWMWEDAGACVPNDRPNGPKDKSCDSTHGNSDNATCADSNGISQSPGPRTRCPHWGDTRVPRDKTWAELASYFARVALWYTRGGFVDDQGVRHESGYYFNETKIVWEVWNEITLTREHNMLVADYTAMYDAQVASMTHLMPTFALGPDKTAWRGTFAGPSFCGLNVNTADDYLGPLLNCSTHTPATTPLHALTFHQYATCHNTTGPGLEPIFPATVKHLPALIRLQQLRDALRPSTSLHLTESGIVCNKPFDCNSNDYRCWYSTQDFSRTYWVASAAQWLYQYLLSAHAADLATVAQSQILGYPFGFDGLSGEWPCGSMVDWSSRQLNHKYWVQIALLQSVSRPFSYCDTTTTPSVKGGHAVHAQGLTSAKGRVLVLINTKASPQTVTVTGGKGTHAAIIDDRVGNHAAREVVLASDQVALGPFATVFVHLSNYTVSPPVS